MKSRFKHAIHDKDVDLTVALGFECKRSGYGMDLDVSAFGLEKTIKTGYEHDLVFYNQRLGINRSVELIPDLFGLLPLGVDEQFRINTKRIPARIHQIVFAATVYDHGHSRRPHTFADVYKTHVLVDGKALSCNIECTKSFRTATAVIFLQLYRQKEDPSKWEASFPAKGYKNGLRGLCEAYGIELEKPDEEATEA